jgi:hypothetical protein
MRVKSRWTCAWSWLASVLLALGLSGTTTWAASSGDFVTTDTRFWVDTTGRATIEDVARVPADAIQALERPRSFEIDRGALWLRYPVPALDPARRWYLVLEGGAFTNRATLYTPTADGQWQVQEAGDHLPVVLNGRTPTACPYSRWRAAPARRSGCAWKTIRHR